MAAAAAIAGARQAKKKSASKKKSNPSSELALEQLEPVAQEQPLSRWKDPDQWSNPLVKAYLRFSRRVESVVLSDAFDLFIIGVIVVAGIVVGLQTYPDIEESQWCITLDFVILGIFICEVLMKWIMEGIMIPRYFYGPEWRWNNFDFIIVVLCLPLPILPSGGGSVALLRLMRLMRVMKLVKKIQQLQMIIMGLVGGMRSIVWIMVLLFVVFYLFAIIGIYAFRDNDPYHFETLFTAMNTLFRAATLEDWTDIMYINLGGCDWYPGKSYHYDSGIYTHDFDVAVNGGTPRFCAHGMATGLTWTNPHTKKLEPLPTMVRASNGRVLMTQTGGGISPMITIAYFVFFIIISALVMLSLFIGAVTMAMTTSMEEMKEEQEEADKARRFEKAKLKAAEAAAAEAKQEAAKAAKAETDGPKDGAGSGSGSMRRPSGFFSSNSSGQGSATLSKEEIREQNKMKAVLMQAWDGVDLLDLLDGAEDTDLVGWKRKWHIFANWMKAHTTESDAFNNFITLIILLAGTLVGVQTYPSFEEDAVLDGMDLMILAIFTIEVVGKTIGCGFAPWEYFVTRKGLDGWNTFDYFIVAFSFIPMGGGSMVTILRLLRLLRVLKLVKAIPDLFVIVSALISGMASIGYIGLILVLVFYVFGILGMILFERNDPWHFGRLDLAILTLFRCSTFEDWTDVMYINMWGCDQYGYAGMEEQCTQPQGYGPGAVVFFLIFEIIGALVLMTLFIGVVTTSMEEATAKQKEEEEVLERVQEIAEAEGLTPETIGLYTTVFHMLDLDDGGTIEEEELRIGLRSVGKHPSDNELKEMMKAVDEDESGEIDLAEFIQFMVNLQKDGNAEAGQVDKSEEVTLLAGSGDIADDMGGPGNAVSGSGAAPERYRVKPGQVAPVDA